MAAAASLPRPGVEIIQILRQVTPQIVAPTLAPCVMGVCNQIVEVTEADGTINADALVSGPAVATAPNVQASYNLNGLTLLVSVSGGPDQTFTFTGTDPFTATQAATGINGAAIAPVGFAAYAYEDALGWHLQLRSTTSGESQTIKIVGGTALTALGWGSFVGWTYYGLGSYRNYDVFIPQTSLPDPRDIMDELDIDETTIRAFVDLGTEIRELLDSESFLRKDSYSSTPTFGCMPVDDADGDATSPYMSLRDSTGALVNLLDAPSKAIVTGTAALTTPKQINGQTLITGLDGGGYQTITLVGQPIVSTDSTTPWTYVGDIQGNDLVLVVNGVTITVTFVTPTTIDNVVDEINAAVAAVIGIGTIVAYRCNQYGDENASGDYMGLFFGGAPSTNIVANTSVLVEDSAGGSTAALLIDMFGADLHYYQTNTGDKVDPSQPVGDIEAQIDALMGANFAAIDGSDFLVLTSDTKGAEAKIYIDPNSTALTNLGLTAGSTTGGPFHTKAGDELYGGGVLLGTIIEIHSGGNQGRLKLSTEQSLATDYTSWYIISKSLDTYDPASEWGVIVPTPDFYVDTSGDVHVKHDFLRDTTGTPIGTTPVGLYAAYTALRLDVSPDAESPALLAFDDIDDLLEALGPISPDNPLAYGLSIAMANSGGLVQVYGVGVPDSTSSRPYGTTTGWQKVYDFLESKGVWGLAPLTDDSESIQVGRTHVLAMSQPEAKGERVMYCYLGRPIRATDDIAASGTDGDKLSATTFDTKVATLSQALTALGIDPSNITVDDDVFLDFATDDLAYNITGPVINGTVLTVNTTFAVDENTDSFYSTTDLTALTLISETFSVMIRGAAIPATTTGKNTEISTISARGVSLGSRRIRMVQCDKLRASVDGVEQLVDGFYMGAAKVGQVAGNPPSTPYTNFPITGFTGVTGTNQLYSETQMDQGAGGGAEWIIQNADGVPLVSRHQVTTDLTSVETTEQSITNALDYVALFMRAGLRNFIGRYNISDTFLDTLASVVQGQLAWLVEKKVIAGGDINNIIQDAANPTRVLIDCTILPFYPCNYIRLTLIV